LLIPLEVLGTKTGYQVIGTAVPDRIEGIKAKEKA